MRQSAFSTSPIPEPAHVPGHSAMPKPSRSSSQSMESSASIGNMFETTDTNTQGRTDYTGLTCSACGRAIRERFIMKAVGKFWHQSCLTCSLCGSQLTTSLFEKNGAFFCKADYLRKFGPENRCSGCSGMISASELVMRSSLQVYHVRCFCCSHCQKRLNPGDRYVLSANQLLCETDYEESLLSTKLSYYFSTLEPARSPKNKNVGGASPSAN